ncbi:hypothetical protein [Gemmata sp.]|uniref:hypothetical protein n=1 Tax=Gemmata sp. TaxID=1914242 RepID=UPI003F71CBC4
MSTTPTLPGDPGAVNRLALWATDPARGNEPAAADLRLLLDLHAELTGKVRRGEADRAELEALRAQLAALELEYAGYRADLSAARAPWE